MAVNRDLGNLTEAISGRHWAPPQIRYEIARRVGVYRRIGLVRGDRVLIQFGNRLEFFAELLAIWNSGGCAVPVDSRLTAFEVQRLAIAAGARLSVIDDATPVEAARASGAEVVNTLDGADGAAGDAAPLGSGPRLDDDALILFTSGSTGHPKGVVHTHRSLLAHRTALRACLGLDAYARTLCVLPTNFGHGLICNCLFPWLSGCELFIAPPYKLDSLMRLGGLIDEHRITFMSSVPSMWNLALRAARPPIAGTLRRIHVGSAPLSAALWSRIAEWGGVRRISNTYGITETASWVAGTAEGEATPEDGLIGEPWGATIIVMPARTPSEFSASVECRPGEEGMIWLRTPALMKGYFRRDDLTDAAVFQGWFMTGDIGLLDERGRLFLRGRERDEINKGGMKIYPADIDAVVERFPGVADGCTFAIDDAAYGENVALALVLRDRAPAVMRELHAWIADHLAEHKRPVRWYLLEEVPRTNRGKLDRRAVGDLCRQLAAVDLSALLRESRNE